MTVELPTREELALRMQYALHRGPDDVAEAWLAVADVAIAAGAKVRKPDVTITLPHDVAWRWLTNDYLDGDSDAIDDAIKVALGVVGDAIDEDRRD